MKRFRISRRAILDIEEICAHVAEDNIDASLRLWGKFDAALQRLERMPALGHRRTDLADERHRSWSVGSYLIVYLVTDDQVDVAHVFHAARDVRTLLQEEQ